ncbi:hypothetical protein [Mobiluncus curtisii]|uniref:hypothetical protein n=1 Tax=Mobiluncus curtisii TaxID=2051 RepID=UPI00242E129B|nr:hypothetical protein [Mobiluncus curtisii]
MLPLTRRVGLGIFILISIFGGFTIMAKKSSFLMGTVRIDYPDMRFSEMDSETQERLNQMCDGKYSEYARHDCILGLAGATVVRKVREILESELSAEDFDKVHIAMNHYIASVFVVMRIAENATVSDRGRVNAVIRGTVQKAIYSWIDTDEYLNDFAEELARRF